MARLVSQARSAVTHGSAGSAVFVVLLRSKSCIAAEHQALHNGCVANREQRVQRLSF